MHTYTNKQTKINLTPQNKAPTLEPGVISCEVASGRRSVLEVV